MPNISDDILNVQSALDDIIKSSDLRDYYLATTVDEGVLELYGNQLGLLKLAADVLKLAMRTAPGSHVNFDNASNLIECEQALEIGFRLADWELN